MREIRILGPQFGDPIAYMMWIHQTFNVPYTTIEILKNSDKAFEAHIQTPRPIHILAARPAYWDIDLVHKALLENAESVIMVLTRIRSLMHLNLEVLKVSIPILQFKRIIPVVLANDVHGNSPRFPTASATELKSIVPDDWSIIETTIGRFSAPLAWTDGAQEVWNRLNNETE